MSTREQLPPITYLSPADMTPEIQQQRADDMEAMYWDEHNPMSFSEIGAVYGLTRERVRQIFKQYEIPIRKSHQTRSLRTRLRRQDP